MLYFIQIGKADFTMATRGSSDRGKSLGKGKSPSRGKIPISTATEWPKTREEFVKWFWSGTNGNELIKELNCSESHGDDYIRREKERPTIYCIVLNDGPFPGKEGKVQWKLCKVGFTHISTVKGSQNRLEQVQAEIKRNYESKRDRKAEAAVLFVLPIGAVDVSTFSDTEKRIRNAVGRPLHADLAKDLNLPGFTEWVLTTQQFIDQISARKEKLRAQGSTDLIDLFKGLKFKDFNGHTEPSWVKLEDVDGVPTVIDLTILVDG